MSMHLCVTVRFLDSRFHGRGDGGASEWPPSPMRLFQSLVGAAARLGRGEPNEGAANAFGWLEGLEPPAMIVAPPAHESTGYTAYVPNNAMDIVARAWGRGRESDEGDPSKIRTGKQIRPMLLHGEAVHYVWRVGAEAGEHVDAIARCARSLGAVGWGIDVAVGDAWLVSAAQLEGLEGERWYPEGRPSGDGLRVPTARSFEDTRRRHAGFVKRMGKDGFVAPPALTAYRKVEYRRATDPARRPVAAFSLLKPDGSGFRAFHAARKALTVAGMMRRATREAAAGWRWGEERADAFILGHPAGEARFAYLPLPSVEVRGEAGSRRIGAVRRVMLTSFAGAFAEEFDWSRRSLPGRELFPEGSTEAAALLSFIPASDPMLQRYLQPASEWATVTPVVLPGFDDPAHWRRRLQAGVDAAEQRSLLDRLDRRIDGLLRKAITQAGLPEELARYAELEWRKAGFWAGVDLADSYGVPDHLKRFPRYHVRVRWRDHEGREIKIPGPVCLGGGRFYGVGLFASTI